ncbi:MAG: sensor histidine kinase, partial [bacterium]
ARLARDLHDVIAGHLSAIALQSEAVLSMAGDDPATARTVLTSVRHNSVQSLVEMKAMIDLLRAEDTASPSATLADLEPLLDSARAAGLEVTVQAEPAGELPAAVDLTAYRIVQEALTNVARHSGTKEATVRIRARNDSLEVQVEDRGVGFDLARVQAAGRSLGLVGMHERARSLGGSLAVDTTAGAGTRVTAELPLREPAPDGGRGVDGASR